MQATSFQLISNINAPANKHRHCNAYLFALNFKTISIINLFHINIFPSSYSLIFSIQQLPICAPRKCNVPPPPRHMITSPNKCNKCEIRIWIGYTHHPIYYYTTSRYILLLKVSICRGTPPITVQNFELVIQTSLLDASRSSDFTSGFQSTTHPHPHHACPGLGLLIVQAHLVTVASIHHMVPSQPAQCHTCY